MPPADPPKPTPPGTVPKTAALPTPPKLAPVPTRPARVLPKWEMATRERIKAFIRKTQKDLAGLVARDVNEGDTRLFVTEFLVDALGYSRYEDLSNEYLVKGEFADYGLRINKQLVAFLECKRVSTKLNTKHLQQVQTYALNEGVEWLILTNGVVWQVYHLTAALPVVVDLVFEVDLLGDAAPAKKIDYLFLLSRESLKLRQIDELWMAKAATSPKALAKVMLSEAVVTAVRRELKRQTGHSVEDAEVVKLITANVLKADCL